MLSSSVLAFFVVDRYYSITFCAIMQNLRLTDITLSFCISIRSGNRLLIKNCFDIIFGPSSVKNSGRLYSQNVRKAFL